MSIDTSSSNLPPHVHLRMALDVLYSRALDLGLRDTALLIGTAALSAEMETQEKAERGARMVPGDFNERCNDI